MSAGPLPEDPKHAPTLRPPPPLTYPAPLPADLWNHLPNDRREELLRALARMLAGRIAEPAATEQEASDEF